MLRYLINLKACTEIYLFFYQIQWQCIFTFKNLQLSYFLLVKIPLCNIYCQYDFAMDKNKMAIGLLSLLKNKEKEKNEKNNYLQSRICEKEFATFIDRLTFTWLLPHWYKCYWVKIYKYIWAFCERKHDIKTNEGTYGRTIYLMSMLVYIYFQFLRCISQPWKKGIQETIATIS